MTDKNPSPDNKQIAKITRTAFGGEWSVGTTTDEAGRSRLDVLWAHETPEQGLTSFSTIGLSDTPIPGTTLELPLGVELVGTSNHQEFANVLATAGFWVMNDSWVPEPNNVFTEMVSDHFDDVTTPHLFLVPPYLWADLPSSRKLSTKTVAFVMAVPITESERAYFAEHGADALNDALEKGDPDIVNLWRSSVV